MAVAPRRRSLIDRSTPRPSKDARTGDAPEASDDPPTLASLNLTDDFDVGLEVVERSERGDRFDRAASDDSFAMEDPPSEEVRLDPRFMSTPEPATELIDRAQLDALVADEPEGEDSITLPVPETDPESEETLPPEVLSLEFSPQALPAPDEPFSQALISPERPEPRPRSHPPLSAPTSRSLTSDATNFHRIEPRSGPEPLTEVISRKGQPELPADATVPTRLPPDPDPATLASISGHDEIMDFGAPLPTSMTDALVLPPPEPNEEESAPILLERMPSQAEVDLTLPVPSFEPAERPDETRPTPRTQESKPPPRPPAADPEGQTRAIPVPTSAQLAPATSPTAPSAEGEHTKLPVVGILALIGSGGVFASVVVGSVLLLTAVILWTRSGDPPPIEDAPLPPIALPAPPAIEEGAPEDPAPEDLDPEGADPEAEPTPTHRVRRPASTPEPTPEPEPEPEPVVLPPAPEPVLVAPDLEDDEEKKRRGLFNRRKK